MGGRDARRGGRRAVLCCCGGWGKEHDQVIQRPCYATNEVMGPIEPAGKG